MRNSLLRAPLSAMLCLSAAVSMAQDNSPPPSTPRGQTKPTTETTPPAQTGASGQPSTTTQATSPTARKMADQTFVREASAAGLAEVVDAKQALTSAKRPEVRK